MTCSAGTLPAVPPRGEIEQAALIEPDLLEAAAVRQHVEGVGHRERAARHVLRHELHEDRREPVGFRERQRPEEHAVDDAEDGGGGADAERQRERWRRRKILES